MCGTKSGLLTHPSYTSHLLGYGLIKKERDYFDFNIDSIRDYLLDKSKYKKIKLSNDEMWAEISKRRNKSEVNLRKLVKVLLRANLGVTEAKERLLNTLGGRRKTDLTHLSYDDLFLPTKGKIYFIDLAKIISTNWDIFKNSFSRTKQETFMQLDFINKSRADAHAMDISEDKFLYFRVCMNNLEEDLLEAI
ncbi:hypothetical protein [Dickeya fangzhongdai]|uniref:hypothetical protein n=1 Tax=Dickeya fangzhongdai TaxID=1778540 RepID=UPI0023E36EDC|nr:hypothetical protein [Dickeya fangzhongdai]WES87821.1 hypothetical protein PQ617_16510 [Dickeya fangzhongdai]